MALPRAEVAALGWRTLGPADVGAVEALHRRALATLADASWVRRESRAFFEAVLGPDGFGVGVEEDRRLVAYGLVQTRLEAADAAALPWQYGGPPVAKLCGAAVDPAWRGCGLQGMLAEERMTQGRRMGYRRFFATAAPGNVASWVSLLRAGMAIAARGPRYGGAIRYVLVADECRPEGAAITVELEDAAGQAACLARGRRGTAFVPGPPSRLEFRRCRA
jgi:ribosomal protein S18 acetylase RimI-like enzyme